MTSNLNTNISLYEIVVIIFAAIAAIPVIQLIHQFLINTGIISEITIKGVKNIVPGIQ
jgi:hypothetical protein